MRTYLCVTFYSYCQDATRFPLPTGSTNVTLIGRRIGVGRSGRRPLAHDPPEGRYQVSDDQNGATVDVARFNGLMAKHQEALAKLREYEGQGQDDSPAPQYAPGQMLQADDEGNLQPYDPPTPRGTNGIRSTSKVAAPQSPAELQSAMTGPKRISDWDW